MTAAVVDRAARRVPPLATLDDLHDDLTRRRFLAAAAVGGLLTACGSGPTSNPAAQAAGRWTFTDDRDVTVARESRPERIVTFGTAASAMWRLGVKPVGIFAGTPLADSPSLAGLDLSGFETVGAEYGVLNLEKLAAPRPDLIVTAFDPRQSDPVFGFADACAQDKAQALAPIVAIDGIKDPVRGAGPVVGRRPLRARGRSRPSTLRGDLRRAAHRGCGQARPARGSPDRVRRADPLRPASDLPGASPAPAAGSDAGRTGEGCRRLSTRTSSASSGVPSASSRPASTRPTSSSTPAVTRRPNPTPSPRSPPWRPVAAVRAGQLGPWRKAAGLELPVLDEGRRRDPRRSTERKSRPRCLSRQ